MNVRISEPLQLSLAAAREFRCNVTEDDEGQSRNCPSVVRARLNRVGANSEQSSADVVYGPKFLWVTDCVARKRL